MRGRPPVAPICGLACNCRNARVSAKVKLAGQRRGAQLMWTALGSKGVHPGGHSADNPIPPILVRFWPKADIPLCRI